MTEQEQIVARRQSRARKVFIFFLGFPISLTLGWVFGKITNPETYEGAHELQAAWYGTVSRMSPVALVTGYVDDVIAIATTGEVEWKPETPVEPRKKSAAEIACDGMETRLKANCKRLQSTGNGLRCVEYDRNELAAFLKQCPNHPHPILGPRIPSLEAQRAAEESIRNRNPREFAGRVILSPLFGIARTWGRITHEGGISYFLAVVMLLGGLIGFMALYARLFSTWNRARYLPEGIWGKILLVPPGVVACSSVVCFFLKYIMLGALSLFGWITGLAGLCCAATGAAGYVWWISHKFAQYSIGKVIAPKA